MHYVSDCLTSAMSQTQYNLQENNILIENRFQLNISSLWETLDRFRSPHRWHHDHLQYLESPTSLAASLSDIDGGSER